MPLPDGWAEFPPDTAHSPYEVARFIRRDHAVHLCLVFRIPGSPGLDPHGPAARSRERLEKQGFGHFETADVTMASRPAVRLTFDKTTPAGPWVAREYFVPARSVCYCLGLASGDPEGDRATFDRMAAMFEVGD